MKVPKSLSELPARQFPKNNIVIFQGEVPRNGYIVQSGTVRVYSIDNDGGEQIVGFYSKDDIFPLDWLFSDVSSALFYYETLTPSELQPFSRADFATLESQKEEGEYISYLLRKEVSSGSIKGLALQQSLASAKIIYLFYYFSIRFGKEVTKNVFNLGLPLTHQLIADCLGLTRETVAGELSRLKKTGALAYRKKQYFVNKKLLIQAVGKEITDSLKTL
jgi:CRP/FNR family transcriptional regulator, cyclic AMP receptor protein